MMEDKMIEDKLQQVKELLLNEIDENLGRLIISNPREKGNITKVKLRPVLIKNRLMFQQTAYVGNQVFHENFEKDAAVEKTMKYLTEDFRQCEIESSLGKTVILISKKGKITVTGNEWGKRTAEKPEAEMAGKPELSHNRTKTYILKEGIAVPFLIDLGVQTPEGKIVKAKYDKFKQINRFLEFIEDILPTLPKEKTLNIIDFGCGKSYLTFAIYYYLTKLQGREVRITGLDLKKEVIAHCNGLAEKYGYDNLKFLQGDISAYERGDGVDEESGEGRESRAGEESGEDGESRAGEESGEDGESRAGEESGEDGGSRAGEESGEDGESRAGEESGEGRESRAGEESGEGEGSRAGDETGADEIDMVVTLHACDTATDYALAKAVLWNSKVILSVPCCQHEVNAQIKCNELKPVLKYGLLKERMSALFTDAVRANLLEEKGYDVQILEFIDMEHTPKNILIRAVRKPGKIKKREMPVKELTDLLHVETTLQKLLQ